MSAASSPRLLASRGDALCCGRARTVRLYCRRKVAADESRKLDPPQSNPPGVGAQPATHTHRDALSYGAMSRNPSLRLVRALVAILLLFLAVAAVGRCKLLGG